MTTETVPASDPTIEELSPEWFDVQKSFFYPEDHSPEEAKIAYHHGQKYLKLLERVMATPVMPDEIEILKHYTGDPNCRTCRGSKRLGWNRLRHKDGSQYYQLQLCYCTKQNETEYAKLETMLMESLRRIDNLGQLHTNAILAFGKTMTEQNKIQKDNVYLLDGMLSSIDRHTLGYWISRVITPIIQWVKSWKFSWLVWKTIKEVEQNIDANQGTEAVHQPAQQG